MASALDTLYGVLFRPRDTFERLVEQKRLPWGLSLSVFALSALTSGWVVVVNLRSTVQTLPAGVGLLSVLGLLVLLAFGAMVWFASAAMFHLIAEFLGGEGSGRRLFVLLGLAFLPRIFAAPVAVLERLGSGGLGLLSFAVSIWVYVLYFFIFQAMYDFSAGRALMVLLLPLAAAITLAVLAAVLAVAAAAVLGSLLPDLLPRWVPPSVP